MRHGNTEPIDHRRRQLLLAGATFLAGAALAHHKLSKEQCRRIAERMRELQSRLRQAHTARQGRAYRERLRALQLQRFRMCR